jgi:hypothetical protein
MKFYLPIRFGLPVSEFALCVDDEMGISGSSAISRGISNQSKTKRGLSHYSRISPKFWISKYKPFSPHTVRDTNILEPFLIKRFTSFVINTVNTTLNTLEFILFEVLDSKRKGSKN